MTTTVRSTARRRLARAMAAACALTIFVSCNSRSSSNAAPSSVEGEQKRLPTGAHLDPAGRLVEVMPLPLALLPSPEGDALVLLASGYLEQGIQVIDRASGRVRQSLPQRSAFVGLAFSPDGRSLWASGGNEDMVYRYQWNAGRATLADSIRLSPARTDSLGRVMRRPGVRYPAGVAPSRDGRFLYVAENLGDSLAVIDIDAKRVVQRLSTGRYPYGVVVAPNGGVYVSTWGGSTVAAFKATWNTGQPLAPDGMLRVSRHPSALLLNASATRLFVASGSSDRVDVVDLTARRVLTTLFDPPPAGPREGSTPNALALSSDGSQLYVAEGDANAVAVFALDSSTADVGGASSSSPHGGDRLVARVPAGWYPSAVLALGDSLYVANGKGRGTRANPMGPGPIAGSTTQRHGPTVRTRTPTDTTYTWGQLRGTLMAVALPLGDSATMARLTMRVSRTNGWDAPSGTRQASPQAGYPPIQHVVYIVKENRTYDQVFGDLPQGDGDTSLVFFTRAVAPNQHALADRFGLFDRFFVNAESSPDGHNWSMAAYTTDYVQKTVPSNYSERGRSYDYEGTNRGEGGSAIPEDDVAEPANGYLWNLVQSKGLTFRNYGEFVVPSDARGPLPPGYRGNKPFLAAHTNAAYPGYNLDIPDQRRADVWIAEFNEFVKRGSMPALSIVRLPNDHTAGAKLGAPTPRAYMADNDLALGRIIDALSHSPFWKNTVVFVLEDDSQNGPDHVDSHRSPLLVISPWSRGGVTHRFANTTDVLATIEELLGLGAMSQFDFYGRPLREIWAATPDLRPFSALTPAIPLSERNTASNTTPADARASAKLALDFEDQADERIFNQILWRTIRGASTPYPGIRRISTQDLQLAELER